MNPLPHVMVLEFQPRLTHSVWVDYHYKNRTMCRLLKQLRKEVKSGRFIGYRFITIHKEVYGVDLPREKNERPQI